MKPWTNALWTFSQFPAYFAPTWPKDQEELPPSTGRQSEWVFRDSWSWLLTMHLQRWRISILRIILVGFSSAKFSTKCSQVVGLVGPLQWSKSLSIDACVGSLCLLFWQVVRWLLTLPWVCTSSWLQCDPMGHSSLVVMGRQQGVVCVCVCVCSLCMHAHVCVHLHV